MKNAKQRRRRRRNLLFLLLLCFLVLFTVLHFRFGHSNETNETEASVTENKKQTETETVRSESSENKVETAVDSKTEETQASADWQSEDFVFYFQDNGQPWSDDPHGSSTIASSGCGTVSLAMCLASLTGDEEKYTPGTLAAYERKHDIAPPNQDVDCIPLLCDRMKTGCTAALYYGDLDLDLVDETLEDGGYIILDQQADTGKKKNSEIFAHFNHYIVIRKGNQKDGYYIANSLYKYSKPGSDQKYAPQNGTCIPAEMFQAKYYYTVTKD